MNICPRCNSEFNCGKVNTNPCWCNNYTLTKEQLEALVETYSGCLCPKCLDEMTKLSTIEIKKSRQ